MKLADRLIIRELLGPIVNSIFMFLIVLFATVYLSKLTDLLVRGEPFSNVARMALFSLPMLMTQTLPMSVLLGSLLAFGRLSGDSEHVALFAGGISFYRAMRPVASVGLVVSVLAFVWNEAVVPPSSREFFKLSGEALEGLVTSSAELYYPLKVGDHVDEIVQIYGGFDKTTGYFRKVTITKMSEDRKHLGEPAFCVYAERAKANSADPTGLDWTFEQVRITDLRGTPGRPVEILTKVNKLNTQSLQEVTGTKVGMGKTFKGVILSLKPDNRSMTFGELRDKIREERKAGIGDTLADEVDLWGKISTPLASLVFGMLGAPLGIRPHRGSKAMGFGMAIALIFLYWLLYNWLYQIGKNGGLPPLAASFAPNAIGVIAGIILISRTRQ
jgi:lipopolysaccharide export system permease protein